MRKTKHYKSSPLNYLKLDGAPYKFDPKDKPYYHSLRTQASYRNKHFNLEGRFVTRVVDGDGYLHYVSKDVQI